MWFQLVSTSSTKFIPLNFWQTLIFYQSNARRSYSCTCTEFPHLKKYVCLAFQTPSKINYSHCVFLVARLCCWHCGMSLFIYITCMPRYALRHHQNRGSLGWQSLRNKWSVFLHVRHEENRKHTPLMLYWYLQQFLDSLWCICLAL